MVDALLSGILANPLDEVVAARDEAVRRLRREKRAGEAAQLARLRRPSPPLWAANRLHDVDPQGLENLLAAGDEVRSAQAALLAGQRDAPPRLSDASDRLTKSVRRLAGDALRVLEDGGHATGADAERRLHSMLRAAAVADEQTRQALTEGRLLAEPQPAGFDLPVGATLQPRPRDAAEQATPAPARTPQPDDQSSASAAVARRERRMELERALTQRRQAAGHAEREAADRRGRVVALQAEATELERRLESLRKHIADEREAAASAEAAAAETRAAVKRAQAALGDAGDGGEPAAKVTRRRR